MDVISLGRQSFTHWAVSVRGLLALLLIAASFGSGNTQARASSQSLENQVDSIFDQMTPEQRVGQIFLVTYYGSDAEALSSVHDLITRYHVGGIVISVQNDNLVDGDPLPDQLYRLARTFQSDAAAQAVEPTITPLPNQIPTPTPSPSPTPLPGPFVPLFIGIRYDQSDLMKTALQSSLSPIPSPMALGATWDPELAKKTGEVIGEELSGLGINLLLGTSADIVETPQPFTAGDLGDAVFGGEPYWVSRMTSSYVEGIHQGGRGRLAVIVGHFPGYGAADRLASVEVPIVRRSLDQLTQFELIPFFAITGNSATPFGRADGLLAGHISYRGFQGDNPRTATRPISLDSQALQALLKLDPIEKWRSEGGLVVSDSLGLRGVRRFYNPQETLFPNRRIAQDALLAGNDVLFLSEFGTSPPDNQFDTVTDTIDYFVQAYTSDPAIRARVDDAVKRILRKKLEMYAAFNLENNVLPTPHDRDRVGLHGDIAFGVAQKAVTLLSPNKPDLLLLPQSGDRIVIFTDTRPYKLCAVCAARPTIAVDALQSAILRLYGPQASALVRLESIQSFSFEQLSNYLQYGPQSPASGSATPSPDSLAVALNSADWIVFVMQDVNPAIPSSDAIKRFLASASPSRRAQIAVMATSAPYYLDSTEISKLSAYYGLYGSSAPFVDVAARALFLGVPLSGYSPVSVSGINYNIADATSPDSNQVIRVFVEASGSPGTVPATSPSVPVLGKGDTLRLSTGVILDHNGHQVPDGTPVEFVLSYAKEGLRDTVAALTSDGKATTSLILERAGELQITVQSDRALQSDTVRVFIPDTGSIIVTVLPPNIAPTQTASPTVAPGLSATSPAESRGPSSEGAVRRPELTDLLIALIGLLVVSGSAFWVGYLRRNLNNGLLAALPSAICGLFAYNYYALMLPGSAAWSNEFGDMAPSIATWASALLGLLITLAVLYGRKQWLSPLLKRR